MPYNYFDENKDLIKKWLECLVQKEGKEAGCFKTLTDTEKRDLYSSYCKVSGRSEVPHARLPLNQDTRPTARCLQTNRRPAPRRKRRKNEPSSFSGYAPTIDAKASKKSLRAGRKRAKAKDYSGSISEYKEAVRLDSSNAWAYTEMAYSYGKLGTGPEAKNSHELLSN